MKSDLPILHPAQTRPLSEFPSAPNFGLIEPPRRYRRHSPLELVLITAAAFVVAWFGIPLFIRAIAWFGQTMMALFGISPI